MANEKSQIGVGADRSSGPLEDISVLHSIVDELTEKTVSQSASLDELKVKVEEARKAIEQVTDSAASQLASLKQMAARAQGLLGTIEEDTRKANSESAFAFNAKGNAEEHAKAVAQVRGTVESAFSGLSETRKSIEAVVSAVTALQVTSEADAKAIAAVRTVASKDAASVVASAERVAAIMPAIEKGSKDANTISASLSSAESNAASLGALQTQMSEVTAKAVADASAINKSDIAAKALVADMVQAAATATTANQRVEKYEGELVAMGKAYEAMNDKLEGLLPHATSVGLASAFHNQKARFSKPQPYWLGLFVAAIFGLLLAAAYGIPNTNDSWDALLRHFVNRLPIVAPLVWLAIYAGHQYNMALRMEEDYAFKEAVSTAFEGYKREMLGIPSREGSSANPLVTLCENVLSALAERPGRIYEGRTDVVTPLTPATSLLKDAVVEITKGKPTT